MSPHLITALRIIVAPFFAYSFVIGYRNPGSVTWLWLSLVLLVVIELSDAMDGQLARRRNLVSDFGKFFDPVADSVSRLTVFVAFLLADAMPLWMFLIFLYRDTFVQGIRYLCIKQGTVVPARLTGKLKAIFQALGSAIVVLLPLVRDYLTPSLPGRMFGVDIGYLVMLFPALFTAYSAFDYWQGTESVVRQALKRQ